MMEFGFPLLSDPGKVIAEQLEAKRSKSHPLSLLPRRITYLIDPQGVIARSYDVGRHIKGHADEVLGDLRALSAG
jgi:peroxiredoxin